MIFIYTSSNRKSGECGGAVVGRKAAPGA